VQHFGHEPVGELADLLSGALIEVRQSIVEALELRSSMIRSAAGKASARARRLRSQASLKSSIPYRYTPSSWPMAGSKSRGIAKSNMNKGRW
jgi:hypothetical protein